MGVQWSEREFKPGINNSPSVSLSAPQVDTSRPVSWHLKVTCISTDHLWWDLTSLLYVQSKTFITGRTRCFFTQSKEIYPCVTFAESTKSPKWNLGYTVFLTKCIKFFLTRQSQNWAWEREESGDFLLGHQRSRSKLVTARCFCNINHVYSRWNGVLFYKVCVNDEISWNSVQTAAKCCRVRCTSDAGWYSGAAPNWRFLQANKQLNILHYCDISLHSASLKTKQFVTLSEDMAVSDWGVFKPVLRAVHLGLSRTGHMLRPGLKTLWVGWSV